ARAAPPDDGVQPGIEGQLERLPAPHVARIRHAKALDDEIGGSIGVLESFARVGPKRAIAIEECEAKPFPIRLAHFHPRETAPELSELVGVGAPELRNGTANFGAAAVEPHLNLRLHRWNDFHGKEVRVPELSKPLLAIVYE